MIYYIYPENIIQNNAREISVLNTVNELKNMTDIKLVLPEFNCKISDLNIKFNTKLDINDCIFVKKKFLRIKSNKIFNYGLLKLIKTNEKIFFYTRHIKAAKFLLKHKLETQKLIFESHECFSIQNKKLFDIEKKILTTSDMVILNNVSTKNELEKYYNIKFKNYGIAYNGVKIEEEHIPKKNFTFNEIAYFGSFAPWKGLDLLINLLVYNQNIKLFLYGNENTDGAKALKQVIKDKNLQSRIVFLGYLSQAEVIEELKKNIRLLIIPNTNSTYSNYSIPIKLFEYLYTKNIVIVPDFNPFKELITDKKNGFIYEAENISSLINVINKISLMSIDELDKIATTGHNSISNFTWSSRAQKIFETIDKILQF